MREAGRVVEVVERLLGSELRDYHGAVTFDGVDDFIEVADPASGILDFGAGDFTVECWFRDTGARGRSAWIVGKQAAPAATSAGWRIQFNASDGVIFQQTDGTTASTTTLAAQAALQDGDWHHIRVIRRAAGRVDIYVDGRLALSEEATARNVSNATSLRAGLSGSGTIPWQGSLRDLRIWNAVHTDADWKAALGGSDAGLVGYWPLSEGSGTTATDRSPSGNNGTLTGGPTWSGETVLRVADASDFDDEGGVLTLNDAEYDYKTRDLDADTVTLVDGAFGTPESLVTIVPATPERTAYVQLAGSDEIVAADRLPVGMRESGQGEGAILDSRDDGMALVDLPGAREYLVPLSSPRPSGHNRGSLARLRGGQDSGGGRGRPSTCSGGGASPRKGPSR